MYLHCASELLSKICHTLDKSRISVDSFYNYPIVYGLNCKKLIDSVGGQSSMHWKTMKNCLRDILKIGAGYVRAKSIAEPNSVAQPYQVSLKSKQ